jgi:hypothetical protein
MLSVSSPMTRKAFRFIHHFLILGATVYVRCRCQVGDPFGYSSHAG